MRQPYFKLLFFILSLFLSFDVVAWNSMGHMVVADVAYENLKPAVRDKVDYLIGSLHQEYPHVNTFADLSYWLDGLRSQKIETYTHWHYIDVPFTRDKTPLKDTMDSDNAVWALNHFGNVLKNEKANPFERGRFLAFFVHVVGDLHQPLHTVSEISQSRPNGDEGGNLYSVEYKQKKSNLHSIWDNGAGVFDNTQNNTTAKTLATTLSARYPVEMFTDQINQLDPDEWTKEGMGLAQKYVYNTPEQQPVSPEYIESTNRIAEQQVVLAGYRLAAMLNKLLA